MKLTPLLHTIFSAVFLILFVSAQQTGCRRNATASEETVVPAASVRSSDFLVKRLQQSDFKDVESLSARAKISAESDEMGFDATANLIWIRDSALWINVKKLGFEAVRALITRDSVIVLNRLDNTYVAQDIDELRRRYSLPEGFPLLQDLLLASAWLAPDLIFQSDIKDSLHRLVGSNNRYSVDYRLEEGSFRLRQETFLQQRDARMLTLRFDQFKKLPGAGVFPYLRHIEAFSPESGNVRLDIEFTDVEINQRNSFRFEIPAHYRRTE